MLLAHLDTLHHYGMSASTYPDEEHSGHRPFDKDSSFVAGVWVCFQISALAYLERCEPVTFEACKSRILA